MTTKPLLETKFLATGAFPRIYAPIGFDNTGTHVFSYRDISTMTDNDWNELLTSLNVQRSNADDKGKERIDERIRYVKNMMTAIGYTKDNNKYVAPMRPMENLKIVDLIYSNEEFALNAATRFTASSDTDKKKVAKFLESYKAHASSRNARNVAVLTEAIMIQHPWMLITQPTMELVLLKHKIENMKLSDPQFKKVIEIIDNEINFRKRAFPSIQAIDNSCDLVALKESRDQLTKYLASAIHYFGDAQYTKMIMQDNILAPYHLIAGNLLKFTNTAIERVQERIKELSLATNDNRYTIQVNAAIERLNVYYDQLKSYFEDKPGKRYSVELAYIMPTLKSIRDTLTNMHELYIWYENRLGKDKSKFTLPTCPNLEHITEKRVKQIGKMSFPQLYLALKEDEAKYTNSMFNDHKIAYNEDMEYIRRVIRERLKYIQNNDDAVPRQSVKFITEYTEEVVKALEPIHKYMSSLYDKINNLLPRDFDVAQKKLEETKNLNIISKEFENMDFKKSSDYEEIMKNISTSKKFSSNTFITELIKVAKYTPANEALDADLELLLHSISSVLKTTMAVGPGVSVIADQDPNSRQVFTTKP